MTFKGGIGSCTQLDGIIQSKVCNRLSVEADAHVALATTEPSIQKLMKMKQLQSYHCSNSYFWTL